MHNDCCLPHVAFCWEFGNSAGFITYYSILYDSRCLIGMNVSHLYLKNPLNWNERYTLWWAWTCKILHMNSMVWVHERSIQTERPPLVGEVIANFLRIEVPYGQRDGSLRPYSRFSRQEPLLFYQVAPQLYSWGWVDTVPDPLLFFSGSAGNRTRTSGSVAKNSLRHENVGESGCIDPPILDLDTSWRWVLSFTPPCSRCSFVRRLVWTQNLSGSRSLLDL
jgi:hypothetical protein